MKSTTSNRFSLRACIMSGIALTVLAASAGLAFAGWMEHAPAILMTLTAQGLALCF